MFFPLLVISVGLLLWLWFDGTLRRWASSRVHLQAISLISWVLPVSAVLLVLGTLLVAMVSTIARPYVLVVWPFVVAMAVLSAAYGASLRRLFDHKVADQRSPGRRWAINALIGLVVSVLLFAGMDKFAQVDGNGQAERIIMQPERYTQAVVLYSAQDLQLDDAAAVRQELSGGEHAAYRYRYKGLRLLLVDGHYYFLVGQDWQPRGGTVIILPQEGIRMEFPRSPL
jgi:hypothetical protein